MLWVAPVSYIMLTAAGSFLMSAVSFLLLWVVVGEEVTILIKLHSILLLSLAILRFSSMELTDDVQATTPPRQMDCETLVDEK